MTPITIKLAQVVDGSPLPQVEASQNTLKDVLMIIFTVLGALAFLMIVISGFRYILASGEPEKIAEVKRQMIYAFVGLIVAALAGAIVNFVLGNV